MRRPRRDILAATRFCPGQGPAGRGFSLVEAVISIVIVAGLFVVALNTLGASRTSRAATTQRSSALLLAQDLMAEILQRPYADPDQTPAVGLETGESTGDRTRFDDVDDYLGWSASPPQYPDGTKIPWATAYKREVDGIWVNPKDLAQTSVTETGAKRIDVTVSFRDRKLITLHAVRTNAWQSVPVP